MAAYSFKVIVKATDRLFSIQFHPEKDDDLSLRWHMQEGLRKFTSDEFTVEVDGNFDFKLIVGARQTTKYTYWIKIKSGAKWVDLKKGDRTLDSSNKDKVASSVKIPTEITPLRPIV